MLKSILNYFFIPPVVLYFCNMSVEKTVLKLLYRYDCVIVPDFGGFVARQNSAVFHPLTYTFDPPRKVVGFNSDLVHADGLLASELRKSENLTFDQTAELIQQTVQQWKNQLNQGQTLHLEGLGAFQKHQGTLDFTPDSNQNFDYSTFGLKSVKGEFILRKNEAENIPATTKTNPWLSYAAAVVFAVLVGVSGFFANNELVQPQLSSFFPMLNAESTRPTAETTPIAPVIDINALEVEPPVANTENEISSNQISPETAPLTEYLITPNTVNEVIIEETEEIDLSVKKYQIIGGSFKVYSQAMEHQAKLKRDGYERAVIIGKVGSYFMVAYDTFHSANDALELKRELERKGLDVFMRP